MTSWYTQSSQTTSEQTIPKTLVTIGQISPTDSLAQYNNDGSDGQNVEFKVNSRYEYDKGIYMTGITSPGGFQGASVAFVQLRAPTLLWIADWTALKLNAQPEVPNYTSQDPNWILMDIHLEPYSITVLNDGATPVYRLSGIYVYGHRNPSPEVVTNINFARPQWLLDSFDRTMPTSKLLQNLITGNGSSSTTGIPGLPTII